MIETNKMRLKKKQKEKNWVISAKIAIFLSLIAFLSSRSQELYWVSYILSPIILWGNNIPKIKNNHPMIIGMAKRYSLFIGIVVFTAIISKYDMKIPLSRAIMMISILFFICLSLADVLSKEKLIAMLDGIIVFGLIFAIYLFTQSFNGFVFLLSEFTEDIIGNRNTVGNIFFMCFVASVLKSYLGENKYIFFSLSIFFLLCAFFSTSLKCIVTSSLIFVYYLFYIRKQLSSWLWIPMIAIIIFLLPAAQVVIQRSMDSSLEIQQIFDRFNILIGNTEAATVQYMFMDDREELIRLTWNIFIDNPIFGIGLENSRLINPTYSHNTYVEILAGGGTVLFISFITFIIYELMYLMKKKISILLILIFGCIIYISNALRIYDNIFYVFLLYILVLSKAYINFKITSDNNA